MAAVVVVVLLVSCRDGVCASLSAGMLYSKRCTSLRPYTLSPSSTVSGVLLGSK